MSKEYQLLSFLLSSPKRIYSVDELISGAWGEESLEAKGVLKVYINSLRKKIEPNPKKPEFLKTVYRKGYLLDVD